MTPLYRCIAAMDVHQMRYVLTVLTELDDGAVEKHPRAFGGFQRDRRARVAWWLDLGVTRVVMESTGIDWNSPYAALEHAGIPVHVVNARHVKNVPGRQTALSDAEWLAQRGGSAWSNRVSSRPKTFANRAGFRAIGSHWPKPSPGKKSACTKCSTPPVSNWVPWSRIVTASPPKRSSTG